MNSTEPARRRGLNALLGIPLFYKILVANAAIVVAGMVAAVWVNRSVVRAGSGFPVGWILGFAAVGVLLTILVNAVILRLALTPLKLLEETAASVQNGDLDARVPFSPLRDKQLERLTGTFNGMLDTLESYRLRLSALAVRAMRAEEEERKRIARELHDDTAQSLASLLIRLRLLRSVEGSGDREIILEQFRDEIGEALERIRRFARGLRPPALDDLGLVPALESHVRALSESVGIPIRIDADPLSDILSREAELALYRIAQEATSNAVRHANPGRVILRLQRVKGAVVLTVTDDGSGFVVDSLTGDDDRGLGIFGMQERAAYVGGTVTLESGIGRGTVVRATIPI